VVWSVGDFTHLFYDVCSNVQGGPAKVRPTYIFDGNSATFIRKQVVIHKKTIIINPKANKYQQTYKQTILLSNFINFLKT